ncbi:MAG: RIP metalloprotease RseP [Mariprofundaceae bacterium]
MMELIHTTLAFVVAISLLVAVHEYGHFITARKLGIRVEKFSIGFGPALVSWMSRDGEVRYVIALIPLGGYVKMLGENPDEQGEDAKAGLSEAERARAFDVQPVWKRALVAVAGPAFNFLFAIVAYAAVAWIGQEVLPPVIGDVRPASVAMQADLRVGDRVLMLNGHRVRSWREFEEALKASAGGEARLRIRRDDAELVRTLHVPRPEVDPLLADMAGSVLGMSPGLRVVIEKVRPGSPAARGGLTAGDVVTAVNGMPVSRLEDFVRAVKQSGEAPLELSVERAGAVLHLSVRPERDDDGVPRIGVALGARSEQPRERLRMGLLEGAVWGVQRTWEMTALTLSVVGKMVTAAIPADNLGGPIAIAQLAGRTAELGLVSFLGFLALISVNLGVLNLMPVPILDGGHLVYLAIEKLRGRPLSPRAMEWTQTIGLVLIIALMAFAFYNDLSR